MRMNHLKFEVITCCCKLLTAMARSLQVVASICWPGLRPVGHSYLVGGSCGHIREFGVGFMVALRPVVVCDPAALRSPRPCQATINGVQQGFWWRLVVLK